MVGISLGTYLLVLLSPFFQLFSSAFPLRCPCFFHQSAIVHVITLLPLLLLFLYLRYIDPLARHELCIDGLPRCCHNEFSLLFVYVQLRIYRYLVLLLWSM